MRLRKQGGATLIEAILFIVIVGIALGGISQMFILSATNSNFPYNQQRAIALANAYMDEILRKRWDDITPIGGGCVHAGPAFCNNYCGLKIYPDCGTCRLDTANSACVAFDATPLNYGPEGEIRSAFDDVDDYNGLADAPPLDATGAPIAGYGNYSVAVSVAAPDIDHNGVPEVSWNGIPAADVKQIDVTVTTPATAGPINSYRLTAFRVNH